MVAAIRGLSLFSGAGGLDMGVELGLAELARHRGGAVEGRAVPRGAGLGAGDGTGGGSGGWYRPAAYVEVECFAASILLARMEEGLLAAGPVWTDVSTFDARPFRGVVDIVFGGSPCQDLSVAGKRAGLEGARSGLFYHLVRIVRESETPLVLWENVGGAVGALPSVYAAFGDAGYTGAAVKIRAADVGAPHRRERVFLLAYRGRHGLEVLRALVGAGREVRREDGPWHLAAGRSASPRRGVPGGEVGVGDASGVADELQREPGIIPGAQREAGGSRHAPAGRESGPAGADMAEPGEPRLEGPGGDGDASGRWDGQEARPTAQRGGVQRSTGRGELAGGVEDSVRERRQRHVGHGPGDAAGAGAGAHGDAEGSGVNLADAKDSHGVDVPGVGSSQCEPGRGLAGNESGAGRAWPRWTGEVYGWPPGPTDIDGWREYLAAGGPSPTVCRVRDGADGVAEALDGPDTWADQLRVLGNGVVPDQAAAAFVFLARHLAGRTD